MIAGENGVIGRRAEKSAIDHLGRCVGIYGVVALLLSWIGGEGSGSVCAFHLSPCGRGRPIHRPGEGLWDQPLPTNPPAV
jgi:hypothetical protein